MTSLVQLYTVGVYRENDPTFHLICDLCEHVSDELLGSVANIKSYKMCLKLDL